MAKQGLTLNELAIEVKRQTESKHDYLSPSRLMRTHSNGSTRLEVEGVGDFGLTDNGHSQLASHLGIPLAYYKTLREQHPALLDQNTNTLLASRPDDEKRLVRTLDGNARAVLSDRYRMLDNYDLMRFILPVFSELGSSLDFHSLALTDDRIYLKVTTPKMQGEVKKGDVVQMGLTISNSEVGNGALSVLPWSFRLACLNGMVHTEYGKRKAHLGRLLGDGSDKEALALYSTETIVADNAAFFLKVRDIVKGALLETTTFDLVLAQMQLAAGIKIERNPERVVEVLSKRQGLTEHEQSDIMSHLIEGGDLSMWGLANSITRASQDVESYDRATELEALGGKLINLDHSEWRAIVSEANAVSA